MNKISTIFVCIFYLLILTSCDATNKIEEKINNFDEAVTYSQDKLLSAIEEIPLNLYPIRTKGLGEWELTDPSVWTSGFFPGCLWLANELKPDSILKEYAILFTEGLEDQKFNTHSHDVGFMINNSFGHAYRQTGNERYKEVILQTANSLATRFNEKVGMLQSWDGEFQVIMDNMMNLELLFWASKNGGDKKLYDIAVSHANKTIEYHIRKDGGSYHVVHFDPETGELLKKRTHQGYDDESTWARGQAWGLYGFIMTYRETKDEKYLKTALKLADYFITHLPDDNIPFWDLNLPDDSKRRYKDASAATIVLSALLELNNYVVNTQKYNDVIYNIYQSLLSDYISVGTASSGIINHCAYNCNTDNQYDWDASTSWGDYYFLEALLRYISAKNVN